MAAAAASLLAAGARAHDVGESPGLDQAVLAEINHARAHPADYAQELRRLAAQGERGDYVEVSAEEPGALSEAIAFLERQPPLPPLRDNQGLAAAARAHAGDQGRGYGVGHYGSGGDDLQTRLHREGVWAGMVAEDISYGYEDPRAVVRQLIVDSRVPDRGHRQIIFDRYYSAAGVGCGAHARYGAMCVVDFAGAIVQR